MQLVDRFAGCWTRREHAEKHHIINNKEVVEEEAGDEGDPDRLIADNDSLLKLINSIRFVKLTAAEVHHRYYQSAEIYELICSRSMGTQQRKEREAQEEDEWQCRKRGNHGADLTGY